MRIIPEYLGWHRSELTGWNSRACSTSGEPPTFAGAEFPRNRLRKSRRRLAWVIRDPIVQAGALASATGCGGMDVTLIARDVADRRPPAPGFATADYFCPKVFLRSDDHPRFISYLAGSRQFDAMLFEADAFEPQWAANARSCGTTTCVGQRWHDLDDTSIAAMALRQLPLVDFTWVESLQQRDWLLSRSNEQEGSRIVVGRIDAIWSLGRRPMTIVASENVMAASEDRVCLDSSVDTLSATDRGIGLSPPSPKIPARKVSFWRRLWVWTRAISRSRLETSRQG